MHCIWTQQKAPDSVTGRINSNAGQVILHPLRQLVFAMAQADEVVASACASDGSASQREVCSSRVPVSQAEEEAVNELFEGMISSLCVDIGHDVHRRIKMGVSSRWREVPIQLKRRRELYSTIHSSDDTMKRSLEYYATNRPLEEVEEQPHLPLHPHQRQQIEGKEQMKEGSIGSCPQSKRTKESAAATDQHQQQKQQQTPEPTIVTRHQQNHTDIWGNTPPKEPKAQTRCNVCGKNVGVSRFAPHLDKCMGIGTTVRAAAAAAASGNGGHLGL